LLEVEVEVAVLHTDVGHEVRMSRPQNVDRGRTAMKHYAGLDGSIKQTAICIVDETGKVVREAKVDGRGEFAGKVVPLRQDEVEKSEHRSM
jgi:transposase